MKGSGRKYSLIIVAGIAATSIANNHFHFLQHHISGYFMLGMMLLSSLIFTASCLYFIKFIHIIKANEVSKCTKRAIILESLLCLALLIISVSRYSNYMGCKVENESREIGNTIIKRTIKSKIHSFLGHNDEAGVMIAFATGEKEDITPEMKRKFSNSGAMHILALSGMHVGIMFTMLTRILFIMGISHITRQLRLVVVIAIIIFFITVTGYSSSLARAAIMSGIYQILRINGRDVDKTGLLLFTAALLLMIKPDEISNIGFQLSFAAMAGIVIIYPPMLDGLNVYMKKRDRLQCSSKVTKIVMELLIMPLLISISCQITTLPICFYYFGKLPNYYLLTNLAVIPLTSWIVYLFVAIISLSTIVQNTTFLCSILKLLIGILNTIVSYFAT